MTVRHIRFGLRVSILTLTAVTMVWLASSSADDGQLGYTPGGQENTTPPYNYKSVDNIKCKDSQVPCVAGLILNACLGYAAGCADGTNCGFAVLISNTPWGLCNGDPSANGCVECDKLYCATIRLYTGFDPVLGVCQTFKCYGFFLRTNACDAD